MIKSKKELQFYILADRMMNRGDFYLSFKQKILKYLGFDPILSYLETMRKASYYSNRCGVKNIYYSLKFKRLSLKLGFSIGKDVFGYGLVIPHYGTIVVGNSCKIGNYAVLHTSICISYNEKLIGDGLYAATGMKMTSKLTLGNNVSVGANSLVNKSFLEDGILLGGTPAKILKEEKPWYVRDKRIERGNKIEKLKKEMGLL